VAELSIGGYSFKEVGPRRYVASVDPGRLREIVGLIVGEESYLSTISAVDLPKENAIELNYVFWSIRHRAALVVKTRVSREKPAVPTIVDIVPGALGGELEAHDLFGVIFEGNTRLRRGFLVPEDLVSKGIYPMRKDAGV
jgi:NADH-quinone oxidoreductase subunit C